MKKNNKIILSLILALVVPGGLIMAAIYGIKQALDSINFDYEEDEEPTV